MDRSLAPPHSRARAFALAAGMAVLSIASMIGVHGSFAALDAVIGAPALRLALAIAVIAGLAGCWCGQVADARRRRATPAAKPWWPRFPLVTLTVATVTSLVSLVALVSLGAAAPDTSTGLFGHFTWTPCGRCKASRTDLRPLRCCTWTPLTSS